MILKRSGVTDLAGLRTIFLFPVDCNFAFKHVGRAMMQVTEATNSLAPEQFGSRKGHKAIDFAVSKVLTFDILRQLKHPGTICSNDAKSCYDLIGHTQATMSMQRVGVPKSIIQCLFSTLQNAVHKVRTGYGDSSESYGGQVWLLPLHGIGQGNGAGPAIWEVVSTPLLNVRAQCFGCEIVSPLSGSFHKFVGYAFIDDTDIIQSLLLENDQQAMLMVQAAIDSWEHSLKATCGAIVPEKTAWWLVSFRWAGSSWHFASLQECLGDIYVNDINNSRKQLCRLEPNQAYETLGVFIAPDGNSDDQFNKLLTLAKKWSDSMQTGSIHRGEAWLAVISTILRSLSYPLPPFHLTKKQWDRILSPILTFCLLAIDVCHYFPRSLVFASSTFFGLGLQHLHTMQEIAHGKDLLWHTNANTLMGILYHTSFEIGLIEIGFGTCILDIPEDAIQLSTQTLIRDVITFLRQYNIDLHHDVSFSFPQEGNQLIMAALRDLGLSPEELRACNHCHLYLRALYLSDMVTGDSLQLLDSAWNGVRDEDFRVSTWPNFGKNLRRMWDTWRKCLSRAFLVRGRRLCQQLGRWQHFDKEWPWYSDSDGSLFEFHDNRWFHHLPILRRHHLPTFAIEGQPCSNPSSTLNCAVVYINRERIVSTGSAPILAPPSPRCHDSLRQHVLAAVPS
jgi:hypothetical protein